MSEAMDAMLKIGITEPESEIRTVRRQPNSVGYALPENCPKDGGVRTFRFTSVAGRRQHSIILKNRQRFFAVAISYAPTPVRCLRPRPRGAGARSGQGGLARSWSVRPSMPAANLKPSAGRGRRECKAC